MSNKIQEVLFIGGKYDGIWISILLDQEVPNTPDYTRDYSGPIKNATEDEEINALYLRRDLPAGSPLEVVFVHREVDFRKELLDKYLPRK